MVSTENIVNIILVLVIIIQTSYIGKNLLLSRQLNQYKLKKDWFDRFSSIYVEEKNSPMEEMTDGTYQKFIYLFNEMDSLFKNKLLKPVDFMHYFFPLYIESRERMTNKNRLYEKNFNILQRIAKRFNKVDIFMEVIHLMDMEAHSDVADNIKTSLFNEKALTKYRKNPNSIIKWVKIMVWFLIYIRKRNFFEFKRIET